MEIYYNGRCENLEAFTINTPNGDIDITTKLVADSNSVVFSAACKGEEVKLLLTLNDSGICTFKPAGETDNYPGTIIESYTGAHWDNGFYHYARNNTFSFCQYDNVQRMSVEARRDDICLNIGFPARFRRGMVVYDMDFKTNAYQMLVCIAKLAGYYTFERGCCSVLDAICPKLDAGVPKLTEAQLEWLKDEYSTAYQAYITGVGVEDVLPMLRLAVSMRP